MALFEIYKWEIEGRSTPTPGLVVMLWIKPLDRSFDECRLSIRSVQPTVRLETRGGYERPDVRVLETGPDLMVSNAVFQIKLLVETPADLLERLERHRTDPCDVQLKLNLGLTVEQYTAEQPKGGPLFPAFLLRSVIRVSPGQLDHEEHTISRDEWIRCLGAMAFRNILVTELPRPLSRDLPTMFTRAFESLELARRAYDDNRTWNVCSDVLEALEHLAPDHKKDVWEHLAAHYFEPGIMRDRVQEMLIKLAPLIHLGRHAGKTEEEKRIEISRPHAGFVLAVGSTIVSWCANMHASAPGNRSS